HLNVDEPPRARTALEPRPSPSLLLLERPRRGEPLGDELLQALLLLEQAGARQQQDAVAGLEARHDLAVLEIREPRHDLDRDWSIVAQRDDPILAAELVRARILGLRDAATAGGTGKAAREPAAEALPSSGTSARPIAESLTHDRPHQVPLLRRQVPARFPRAHQRFDLLAVDPVRQHDRPAADRDRRLALRHQRLDI